MNLQKGYLKYAFRPSTPCLQSDSVSQEHMYIYKKKKEKPRLRILVMQRRVCKNKPSL